MRHLHLLPALLLLATTCEAQVFETERARIELVTIASGLEYPWGLAFLPDGRLLVTERAGRLRIVTAGGGVSAPVAGVPQVFAHNQGGLLDVALDPDFAHDPWVYLAYAEARGGDTSGTTVARARFNGTALEGLEVLFRQEPAVDSRAHFGGRLAFAVDGSLFVTLGERSRREFAERAQRLDDHFGKIVRIERDGRIPADNPFVGVAGARPEIWSYGHRNPQGAAIHPDTGDLWSTEHGPMGGDELNVVRAGRNYGWPVITYGLAYSGDRIGEGTHREGMEQPLHYWVPSIATSGLAFYSADRIAAWKGNAFVGALAGHALVRLELAGEQVRHEERLLQDLGERIRDVRQGPDGDLYLLTDSPQGRVLRIAPAD